MSDQYILLLRPLVEAFKSGSAKRAEEVTEQILENALSIDSDNSEVLKLVLLLLNYPVVYMKLLQTIVYMQTFGNSITPVIRQQLKTYGNDDLDRLTSSDPNIVSVLKIGKNGNSSVLQNQANLWYTLFVSDFDQLSLESIKVLLSVLVNTANSVLGHNIGDKFLAAAQSSVYASSSAAMLQSVAIKSGLVQGKNESEARRIIRDLMEGVPPEVVAQQL